MRGAVALLVVVVGCGAPDAGTSIEVTPGPVATVTQGNMLQLAVRVPGGAHTFELAIDDPVAALFQVHDLANTGTGAILTLVPTCTALAGASSGTVSMSVRSDDPDIAPVTLSIQIAPEIGGVCAGAPEHAITRATLQITDVPDSGRVLCAKASVHEHSTQDTERVVMQTSASIPNRVIAADGKLLCGADTILMELWPPIDAPAVELLSVETSSCDIAGCKEGANECCNAQPERLAPLTATKFSVPVRSMSEYITGVSSVSMACADVDRNGTPELIFASATGEVTSEIGHDERFAQQQASLQAQGLLAFSWQDSPTTTTPVVLAGFGTAIHRAQVSGGLMTWVDDPQFTFATSDSQGALASPASVLPMPANTRHGVEYVARLSGAAVALTCVSPTCAPGSTLIDVNIGSSWVPIEIAHSDYNGDTSEDLIVAYRPALTNINGTNPIHLQVYLMNWSTRTATSVGAGEFEVLSTSIQIVSAPQAPACDRIYLLSGQTDVYELDHASCTAGPGYTRRHVPTPNEIYALGKVQDRVIIATALGMFELVHTTGTATTIRQLDPLLQEQLIATGNALIDPSTSNYAQHFAPCVATTPSIAFQVQRRDYTWSKLDTAVEGFSGP